MNDSLDNMSDEELADTFIHKLTEEGVDPNLIVGDEEESSGLGDAIGNALSKIGISPENIERVFGLGGCGCGGRKEFLNKIFPFFKKKKEEIVKRKDDEDSRGSAPIRRK
jgi:hypothetical protein